MMNNEKLLLIVCVCMDLVEYRIFIVPVHVA